MSRSRVVAGGLAVIVALAGLLALAGPAAYAASTTFTAPVYAGDFPDASVTRVNGTYWAYATGSAGRNLQVMSSPDLHRWTPRADPLPSLPSWASPGLTWAPSVLPRDGGYLLYYTVHDPSLGHQCISVASSTGPGGGFVDQSAGPLICQTAAGGSIDPNPYVDPVSGSLFLLWKSDDNSQGQATRIWGQQLTSDGLALAPGQPSLLLTESAPWQAPSVEGPTVIRSAGRYVLFYGANNYDSAGSGIGYATSAALLGSYTDRSVFGPWLGTRQNAQGPQGPFVFTDGSTTRFVFSAWFGAVGYEHDGVRSLWVGTLSFTRWGTPTVS